MDVEEHEQIPWSQLVAEAEPQVDKRLYLAAGAAAAVVIVVVALRLFGSPAATPVPQPSQFAAPFDTTSALSQEDVTPSPTDTVGAISEADLMADRPLDVDDSTDTAVFLAEWFVTDFFTRDGSSETLASLEAIVERDLVESLPHQSPPDRDQFVEWARAFGVSQSNDAVEVSVAYRSVSQIEGGFVRNPVEAVIVTVASEGGSWRVGALPAPTVLP